MRKLIALLTLAGALSTARAAGYVPHDFDYDELGTVESVREVPIADPFRDLFEHAVKRETAGELVVRTDGGSAVVLRQEATRRFVAGQRVRVVSSNHGPRIELE